MAQYKAKNHVTGETVQFDWNGADPPTEDDINQISDQRRESRITAKQKILDQTKQSFMDRLLTSPAADEAAKFANNFVWHPLEGLHDIGSGIKQIVTGAPSEPGQEYPRVAGGVRAAQGAFKTIGPPAAVAGMLTAPEIVGPAMAGSTVGGAVGEQVPGPPEVKAAGGIVGSIVGGGLAGKAGSRLSPKIEPPPVSKAAVKPSVSTEVGPARPTMQGPARPRANWSTTDPAFKAIAPPQTELMRTRPTDEAPMVSLNDPRSQPIIRPPQPEQGQVISPSDPRTQPIAPPPFKPAEPLPPQTADVLTAPLTQPGYKAAGPDWWEDQPPTMAEKQQGYNEVFKAEPGAPPDLPSVARPAVVSPAEVPTSSAQPSVVPPTPRPPQTGVGGPAPPTPDVINAAKVAQAAQAAPPQIPPSPPVPPQATPPTLPKVQPGPVMPPMAPKPPVKSQIQPPPAPPAPAASQAAQPQIQAPMDLAKAALGKIKPPSQPAQPAPPAALPTVKSPAQMQAPAPSEIATAPADPVATASDAILKHFASRPGLKVNSSALSRDLGVPQTVTNKALIQLIKTGQVEKNGTGYVGTGKTPEAEASIEPEAKPPESTAEISPHRTERISTLRNEIGQAEDEGDTTLVKVLREHLQTEERNAQVEQRGTPEQKATLKNLDDMYKELDQIESKEDSGGTLSNEEKQRTRDIYQSINAIENSHSFTSFFKSERGTAEPLKKWGWRFRSNPIPSPGRAIPRDVSTLGAEFGSANQVLARSGMEGAQEIGEMTPRIESNKHEWVGTTLRDTANFMQTYDRDTRLEANQILDGKLDAAQASPRAQTLAQYLRGRLDHIFSQFPAGSKRSGADVKYRQDYATHMTQIFNGDDWFKGIGEDLFRHQLGLLRATKNLFTHDPVEGTKGTERPLYQNGVRDPSTPYVETRKGEMDSYEQDPKYWFPRYVEGASKIIFDKPWIDHAKDYLTMIPDEARKTKDLATWYLRNYARYDAYPGLEQSWNNFTRELMRNNSRTLLGLDTRLWGLHATRLLTNIFPEVPMKYFVHGVNKLIQDPKGSFDEVGRLGMLPNNILPEYFKRPGEKVDSAINAYGIADFLPDAVAYHGLRQMYLDQGESPVMASRLAVDRTKTISMRVTPARVARFFTRGGPFQPFTQFKQQIFKIGENYMRMPADSLRQHEYGKFMKYLISTGIAVEAYKKFHIATWHLNPLTMANFHASSYERIGRDIKLAAQGHLVEAAQDLGLFLTPAGTSLRNQLKKGTPSFYEPEAESPKRGRPSPGGRLQSLPALP